MKARYLIIIAFAFFIDALQAAFAWGFTSLGAGLQAITPAGGAAAGAVAGCAVSTGVVGCAKGALAGGVAGAAVSAFGGPLGVGLAFTAGVCISLTLGSGLILLLVINGMYYPGYMWAVFIGEAIPGLDVIPGWTFLAIRCVLKKNAGESSGVVSFASSLALGVLSPASATGVGNVTKGISSIKAATGTRARSDSTVKNIYESKPVQNIARQRQQLTAEVGREITRPTTPPPNTAQPYVQTA